LSADGTKATATWNRYNGTYNVVQSASATISAGVATWGAVHDLSAPRTVGLTDGDAYNLQIALSADGTKATAVWQRWNGTIYVVQSASATIAAGMATWGAVHDLSALRTATNDGNAGAPQVALSADGTKATALWVRYNGTYNVVQSASATISAGTATWGAVHDLSAPRSATTDGNAYSPQIALSADGKKATAIWTRSNGTNYVVQSASATIAAGAVAWGATTDLSDPTQYSDWSMGGSQHPLGLSADGRTATAVWQTNRTAYVTSATIAGNTATWTALTPLDTVAASRINSEAVAISADGTQGLAIWGGFDGTNFVVKAAPSRSLPKPVVVKPVTHRHTVTARVYFAQNVYALNAADIATLRALLAKLPAKAKVTSVKVVGYVQGTTNTQGTLWCSLQRARAAAAYLHLRHLGGVFHVSGAGAVGPSSNNRRATITITYTS